MKRAGLVLAWLVLLAMVGVAALYRPASLGSRGNATRWRAIPVDSPVSFPLDPQEESIKLLSWLAAPPRWVRDIRARSTFRLALTVLDPEDRVQWEGEVWRATRTSWSRHLDGSLLRLAWLPRSRLEVADGRLDVIDVRGLVPEGGRLVVQADSPTPGATLLVAAYRHGWRTRAARLRVLAGAGGRRSDELASRISSGSWAELPTAWRERLAARTWERLSALPDPSGRARDTLQLMTVDSDVPWHAQPALGLPLPPGGAVAFNLRRGAVLRASWRGATGRRSAVAPTWLQLVHADGTRQVRFLGVVQEIGPLTIDEPLMSVQLALDPGTEGPRILQASLDGTDDGLLWGDPPRVRSTDARSWLVAPDLLTQELARTSPELGPVRFPVEADGEQLRLVLRPRADAAPLPAFGLAWSPERNTTHELQPPPPQSVAVRIAAESEEGEELEAWDLSVPVVPSAFERYVQGDDPGTARAGEPAERLVLPPLGTARLVISASGVVDVGLRALDPDAPPAGTARGYGLPEELAPPRPSRQAERLPTWLAAATEEARGFRVARYEPQADSPWRVRAPLGRAALLAADRLVRVDLQVRLQPAGGSDLDERWQQEQWLGEAPTEATPRGPERRALTLAGPYELVVEPDRDGRSSAGARTLLGEAPTRVDVPASGRLDVDFRVDPGLAGREVVLRVGPREERRRLLASAGRLRVADLAPGRHEVSVDSPGLFLARARGARPWQVRRVVRLEAGATRTIAIPEVPASLAIHAYGEGGWLEWRLGGGEAAEGPAMMAHPTRRFGRHRLRREGGTAQALSFAGGALDRLSPLVVEVGDDVHTTPLFLELRLLGTEAPIWLRATATWAGGQARRGSRARVVDR